MSNKGDRVLSALRNDTPKKDENDEDIEEDVEDVVGEDVEEEIVNNQAVALPNFDANNAFDNALRLVVSNKGERVLLHCGMIRRKKTKKRKMTRKRKKRKKIAGLKNERL